MLQKTFYVVGYNSANRQFHAGTSLPASKVVSNGNGSYTLTQTAVPFDPTNPATIDCTPAGATPAVPCDGAMAYGYVAQDVLPVESGGHYALYSNLSSAALAFGTAKIDNPATYKSSVDAAACEACHGAPYRKHGYREAIVTNSLTAMPTSANAVISDMAACKACHYDDRTGSHPEWQQMVDDPLNWATGKVAPTGAAYAYKASVMQDTHRSHAMEFPYPMSMAVCSTCHTPGTKLQAVLADANFTPATCKSCHPVKDNSPTYPTEKFRAPALEALWKASNTAFHGTLNLEAANACSSCHSTGGVASPLSKYHNGFTADDLTSEIYTADGKAYASDVTVQIDSLALPTCTTASCVLTIKGSVKSASNNTAWVNAVKPTMLISLYGYDTKDFLVSGHATAANGGRFLEWTVGTADTVKPCTPVPPATTCTTPVLWKTVSFANGAFEVTADLAVTQPPVGSGLDTIPTLITKNIVKKAEVAVLPNLTVSGRQYAVNAVSKTIDLKNKAALVADWYQGKNALVSEAKCNACHDQLGTTFHNAAYGGSIVVCRACHVPVNGGSHLEVQSRSIDSYVHAIHAFQAFDTGDVNFKDPVAAVRYSHHVEHTFPNFTMTNCEGCHVTSNFTVASSKFPVTYEVPDQTASLPGLLSGSEKLNNGWYVLDANGKYSVATDDRKIRGVPSGVVPSYMTGPASRACGGCHRAEFVNEDDPNGLAAFNQHTNANGYLVDTSKPSTVYTSVNAYVYGVIQNIMSYF
jgi:hypothetical protein